MIEHINMQTVVQPVRLDVSNAHACTHKHAYVANSQKSTKN